MYLIWWTLCFLLLFPNLIKSKITKVEKVYPNKKLKNNKQKSKDIISSNQILKESDDDNKLPNIIETWAFMSYFIRSIRKSSKEVLSTYDKDEIRRVVKYLAKSQSAVKSIDGVTHQMRNSIKASTPSLQDRFNKFILKLPKLTKSNRKRYLKEASKVLEYINTIERSLQAAEILQSISSIQSQNLLQDIKLKEIESFNISDNKIQVRVSFLVPFHNPKFDLNMTRRELNQPQRYESNELVVAITEKFPKAHSTMINLMQELAKEPLILTLPSTGFVDEDVGIHPVFLNLSQKIILKLKEFETRLINETDFIGRSISKIRFVGYSSGGVIASYTAMLLDGSLNTSCAKNFNETTINEMIGKYQNNVTCVSIGGAPSISKSIIPRNIISIICGDDVIPRITSTSLENLHSRIQHSLLDGIGKKGFQISKGTAWMKDLLTVAGTSLKQYAGSFEISLFY